MTSAWSRRDFIGNASLLPICAAAVAGLGGAAALAQTPIKRAGAPRLKLALNAYSFAKMLNDRIKGRGTGMTLYELCEFCAENDFDGVDLTGYYFPGWNKDPQVSKVPDDSFIYKLKRRAFQLGLGISGTGVGNDFATADKEARAADVKRAKDWIEVAEKMGAPVIRVFAGPVPEGYEDKWDTAAQWMVEALKECAEHGKKHGVLVGVQNHGDMLKTADDVLKVLKMVDSDWFGVIVDTGYFRSPDPYQDIARVTPYAVNFQIKDKLLGKESNVKTDLKKLIKIIKDGGYRGYVPIETLSVPGQSYDPKVEVTRFLKELREALA